MFRISPLTRAPASVFHSGLAFLCEKVATNAFLHLSAALWGLLGQVASCYLPVPK